MVINDNNLILKVITNRNSNIESRIGIIYILSGIIASIIGLIISIACHSRSIGIYSIIATGIAAIISLAIGFKKNRIDIVIKLMIITLLFTIPMIFINCGGLYSGSVAWFLYQLYFIALSCSGIDLIIFLSIAFVTDVSLAMIDVFVENSFIYHLPTAHDSFISVFFSTIVVAFSIIITVLLFKKIYNDEQMHIIKQSEELEKANQFERMFLANISHELRTPINSIIGFGEMINRCTDDKKVLEYNADITSASDHLLTIVNDILDLNRIESGNITLRTKKYHILSLAQELYNMIAMRISNKGLKFTVKIDPNIPATLEGDKDRLFQIALNLLTNSCKYTKSGEIQFKVYHEVIDDESIYLYLRVFDTGIGIDKEDLVNIFEAYRRVDKSASNIEGSGLGLAITKNYVELMDGEITVESTPGLGSTFVAKVKQKVVENEPVGDCVIPVEDLSERNKTEDEFEKSFIGKTILAVDDTSLNLKLIKLFLKDTGARVVTLKNGFQAINYIEEYGAPDIILMDIMMPRMSGVETMQKIRVKLPNIIVIALTADVMTTSEEEYLNKGFNDYISKPVAPARLEEILNKYLLK